MARARERMGEQELMEAQAELEKAQALAPEDAEVAFSLGDVAYRSLQMEAAEGHYRRAAELDPRSSAALGSLARVLLEQGQAGPAADAVRKAMAMNPFEPRLPALLGECLLLLGEPGAAADQLERALKAGLRGAKRYATLGRARDLLGQREAALKAFEEAVRQDPQQPLVHYWRADCLRRLGRPQEAEQERRAYRRCQERMDRLTRLQLQLTREPNDLRALLEVARLRVERGVPSQAVPPALRAELLAPDDPEVRRVKALVQNAVASQRDVEP